MMLTAGIAVAQLQGLLTDLREEVPRIKAGATSPFSMSGAPPARHSWQ